MKKLLLLLVFLIPILTYSQNKELSKQAKTVIFGTIENSKNDSIELIIDKNYLSQKQNKFKIPVLQNKFSVEFEIGRNFIVQFIYQEQIIQLYLEPYDSLNVRFKSGNLSESIVFSGKANANNQFLKNFNEKFGTDFTNGFIEEKIKTQSLDAFEMLIYDNRKKQKDFYTNYSDKNLFSIGFKKFIENQIKYNYLNFLLSFPVVNANKSNTILTVTPLPKVMLDVLDKKNMNDEEAMISESYRNFLTSFVTYFASELNGFNKFKDFTISLEKKYIIARDYYKGEPFLFYLSKFLLENGEKVNPETVKRIYLELEKEDKTGDFTGIVKEKLGKWMKTKLPKDAVLNSEIASPEFKLEGFNGKDISLEDFKGKVIYVDFWASWCGPCRQEFPYSKLLHDQLSEKQKKQVVFLYISIDNTEEIWKKALNELQLEGEHALSPGGWNSFVVKHYQIKSIPRYLLIDKKGNVVNQNAGRPSDENTLQDILNLIE